MASTDAGRSDLEPYPEDHVYAVVDRAQDVRAAVDVLFERGHFAVGVHVIDEPAKDEVNRVLREHGGHFIHHYGPWEIEKIVP